jgi:hypothetical protein
MSLLEEIEAQGNRLAQAERETREALQCLQESNAQLSVEVKERTLAERRLRILCDTMSDQSISLPERIMKMLKEACENFDLDAGILAQIDKGMYRILYSYVPPEGKYLEYLAPGMIRPLDETYCRALDQDGTSIAVENVGKSAWHTHPLYIATKLETYLGVCVNIHHKFWGSLCFVDLEVHVKPFAEPDHDFLRLMSQWIGAELSLQQQRLEP